MSEKIRFHLDENVDPDIARALRRMGVDVTTTSEVGLKSQSDEAQLAFAYEQGRVIFTHDADFLRLAKQSTDHCGIVFSPKTARTMGDLIRYLALMAEVYQPEEMYGMVEFL